MCQGGALQQRCEEDDGAARKATQGDTSTMHPRCRDNKTMAERGQLGKRVVGSPALRGDRTCDERERERGAQREAAAVQ